MNSLSFKIKNPSLYVHIPFCIAKCDYCDFFSVKCSQNVSFNDSKFSYIPDSYVEALLKEAEFYAEKYSVSYWKTVYFGGGTPSLLNENQLEKLINGILNLQGKYGEPEKTEGLQEITVELNPETVTEEKLEILKKCGVNRISVGIQSLDNKALSAVKRHCSAEKALNALEIIKSNWNKSLNLDVMAGLPYLSDEEFLEGLETVISYNPDHISMYTLTVEEDTPLYENIEKGLEFDSDVADRQWLKGFKLLKQNGYFQYEVSNFAKKGFESRHNMTYWQNQDYIGIGSGATGTVYNPLTEEGLRWTNTTDISSYITDFKSDITYEEISLETREFEYLMMGLRTLNGIDARRYSVLFKNVNPWYGNLFNRLGSSRLWNQFVNENKAFINEDRAFLAEEGLLFLNELLLELI